MFSLTEEQRQKLEDWVESRPVVTPDNAGANGGAFTYSFTPTTLGTVVMVVDNRDGAEINLTEYGDW